jgi:hypothetical protein
LLQTGSVSRLKGTMEEERSLSSLCNDDNKIRTQLEDKDNLQHTAETLLNNVLINKVYFSFKPLPFLKTIFTFYNSLSKKAPMQIKLMI